jgi:glyoxylase-like metal-dependent hydrolase (beta-lactamase superfamily II)
MFAMINSLRLLAQLPDNTRILPGHGTETTIGNEISGNPYMDR